MTADHPSTVLAETRWVAENLDNPALRIIEVSSLADPEGYDQGHIPGAVNWTWQEALWQPQGRDFATPQDLADLMGRSGVGPETAVVFYSSQFQYATYAFWVCTLRGYKRIGIMNGDRDRWVKEGRPLTRDLPLIRPASCAAPPVDETDRIGREGVRAGLGNPDRVLLDMRSIEEYRGERVSPPWFQVDHGATVKGHIPGARHLYYNDLLEEEEKFQPLATLREKFLQAGATPDREIVTYCRLSHRASMAWFILKHLLGYPRVKVYDGSWTEWGSMVGMPVVNESLRKG